MGGCFVKFRVGNLAGGDVVHLGRPVAVLGHEHSEIAEVDQVKTDKRPAKTDCTLIVRCDSCQVESSSSLERHLDNLQHWRRRLGSIGPGIGEQSQRQWHLT